jgi:hypothetical protein
MTGPDTCQTKGTRSTKVDVAVRRLFFLEKKLRKKETRICIKNTFFEEKLFTTEIQGILKGAWVVRRL